MTCINNTDNVHKNELSSIKEMYLLNIENIKNEMNNFKSSLSNISSVLINKMYENKDSYTTVGNKNHKYLIPSTYTVLIYGYLEQFGNVSTPYANADKLITVKNWGDIGLKNLSGAFYGASNLIARP